ncbi:MAG: cyclic pyranopterin monophosphate synthase MoaC [Halobacteriales archaeon]
MPEFSHVEGDRARMVDIGDKAPVDRRAVAVGSIRLRPSTIDAIREGTVEKGQVLATARIAAIQAAKRTPEAIPMCHQLPLSSVDVRFDLREDRVEVEAEVATTARTGVEMEALSAVTGALLTVWDMVKSAEKGDRGLYPETAIEGVRVVEKVKG